MGFFATFLDWLNDILFQYIETNTARIAEALEPAIVTLGVIYVMFWGLLQIYGRIEEPVGERLATDCRARADLRTRLCICGCITHSLSTPSTRPLHNLREQLFAPTTPRWWSTRCLNKAEMQPICCLRRVASWMGIFPTTSSASWCTS